MRTNSRQCRFGRVRRPAFTLIELVVAISVSVIVCGVAGSLLWNAARQRSEIGARVELVDVAARALEQVLRYVREVPQDAGLTGLAQIATATATEIRFANNGFRLNSNDLEMTIDNGSSWHPLTRDVSGLDIAYFDADGTSLSSFPLSQPDRESVRMVRVLLNLSRAGEVAKVQSSIYLRNFMNEVGNAP